MKNGLCFSRLSWSFATAVVCALALHSAFVLADPPAFTTTPRNRVFFWKVTSTTLAPDGVTRPVILVNDKYPGPKIEVNRGDSVTVVVENALNVPTSFHWHGLTMRDDPWYDGVPGLNQCPIPPGTNFTYAFGTDNVVGTYVPHDVVPTLLRSLLILSSPILHTRSHVERARVSCDLSALVAPICSSVDPWD